MINSLPVEMVNIPLADNAKEAAKILKYIEKEMMRRYEKMEEEDVNNAIDLSEKPNPIIIKPDILCEHLIFGKDPPLREWQELLDTSEDANEALLFLGSIWRLSRAADIHFAINQSTLLGDNGFDQRIVKRKMTNDISIDK